MLGPAAYPITGAVKNWIALKIAILSFMSTITSLTGWVRIIVVGTLGLLV